MSLHVKNFVCSLRSRSVSSFVTSQSAPRTFSVRNQQFTRAFNTTPFVWCENRNPIRVNESVDSIEGELSTLFKEGCESSDLVAYAETFQLRKEMLESKGFELIEHDDEVTIKGSKEGRKFTATWDPNPVEDDEDDYDHSDYEDENDQESDNEDQDPDELDELSDAEQSHSQVVNVNVRIEKGEGQELHLQCGVNEDAQFLIYRIGSSETSMVVVSELAESIQHKVYDYLDELGIGDGAARFIRDYNQHKETQQQTETLKYVAEFFAK